MSKVQVAFDKGTGSRCISHIRENPYSKADQPAEFDAWERGWAKTDDECNRAALASMKGPEAS